MSLIKFNLKNKILLVDDHQIVISGIQLIFMTSKFECILESCFNGNECIKILDRQSFDLIILDVNLPDTDTFQLVNLILVKWPNQKILIYSMSAEEVYAKRFFQLGVMGYLSKQASNEDLLVAIQRVLAGDKYLSKNILNILANEAIKGHSNNVFEKLSPREFEIMTYFLRGQGSKEVASLTNLHSSTIGTYKFKIFDKLGIRNVLELQELAKVHGIK